jgi:UDP:flavonoid glycosyltransferase YjiC (YdhE family)
MSRFLLAWELGSGLGHAGHLIPLAHALRAAGHHAALALRDLRILGSIDPGPEMPVFQAPFCIHTYENLAEPPLNYAEVLMRFGFLDANMLAAQIRGWRELARATGSEVMVADHAPSAILAARTLGLRCVVVGNGFTVPPFVSPTPNMRPWLAVPEERLADSDRRVVDTINVALARFGTAPIAHLHELFAVDDIIFLDFPELDHYAKRPAADLARISMCGPVNATGLQTISPVWPSLAGEQAGGQAGKRIFAYLKPGYAHAAAVLQALVASGQPCVIYGMGEGGAAAPRAPNLSYSSRLLDLDQAGRECAICITHVGSSTSTLLQHGRPLMLLPMHLEQFLVGLRVAELGAGIVITPEEKQPDFGGALSRLLGEPGFAGRAAAFAARYSECSPDRILNNVLGRLTAVAGGARLPVAGP